VSVIPDCATAYVHGRRDGLNSVAPMPENYRHQTAYMVGYTKGRYTACRLMVVGSSEHGVNTEQATEEMPSAQAG
jgi:hypothetical protein